MNIILDRTYCKSGGEFICTHCGRHKNKIPPDHEAELLDLQAITGSDTSQHCENFAVFIGPIRLKR